MADQDMCHWAILVVGLTFCQIVSAQFPYGTVFKDYVGKQTILTCVGVDTEYNDVFDWFYDGHRRDSVRVTESRIAGCFETGRMRGMRQLIVDNDYGSEAIFYCHGHRRRGNQGRYFIYKYHLTNKTLDISNITLTSSEPEVFFGSTITLDASIGTYLDQSDDKVTISWIKDGATIISYDFNFIHTSVEMDIQEITSEMKGRNEELFQHVNSLPIWFNVTDYLKKLDGTIMVCGPKEPTGGSVRQYTADRRGSSFVNGSVVTFTLINATSNDSGNYSIVIEHSNKSFGASLDVMVDPVPYVELKIDDDNILDGNKVHYGQRLDITCFGRSEETFELYVEWIPILDGPPKTFSNAISESATNRINTTNEIHALASNVTTNTSGRVDVSLVANGNGSVSCTATNANGNNYDSITFVVIERGSITQMSDITDTKNGINLRYSCRFDHNDHFDDIDSYQWVWTLQTARNVFNLKSTNDSSDFGISIESSFHRDYSISHLVIGKPDPAIHNGTITCSFKHKATQDSYVTFHPENITEDVKIFYETRTKSSKTLKIVLTSILLPAVILTAVIVVLIIKIRKEREYKMEVKALTVELFRDGETKHINPNVPISEQVEMLPYDKKYEIDRNDVTLGRIVGKGFFGKVYEGGMIKRSNGSNEGNDRYLRFHSERNETVAIKTTKDRLSLDQMQSLIAELKILIHIGNHVNIVNLLGACTGNMKRGELLVIVEYCRFGNLRDYIITHSSCFKSKFKLEISDSSVVQPSPCSIYANNHPFGTTDDCINEQILISYAFQVAKGMDYLSSKKVKR